MSCESSTLSAICAFDKQFCCLFVLVGVAFLKAPTFRSASWGAQMLTSHHGVQDLVLLDTLTEDAIWHNLQLRANADQIYVRG